jgi:hydrogenase nickel incorporation protein HypA/HybF
MHELSLCQGILDAIVAESRRQAFRRVRGVQLEIGALAGVDGEALRYAWETVAAGTLAATAVLEIVAVPGVAWCPACRATINIGEYYDPCSRCHGHGLKISGGEQLRIRQLEVE